MNPFTSFIKRYPHAIIWGIIYLISDGGYTRSVMYPSDLWPFVLWVIALGGVLPPRSEAISTRSSTVRWVKTHSPGGNGISLSVRRSLYAI